MSGNGTAMACRRILALLAVLFGATAAATAATARPGLFGTEEIHSIELNAFPKWREALTRFENELRSCAETACRIDEWKRLIASLRGWDAMTRLARLNEAVNGRNYVEDADNWQQLDYWATPLQFLARSGDCEDFAIAKYLALRALGTAADDMRIVIVRDRRRGTEHAVLAVYVEGQALILDNLGDEVIVAESVRGYEPIYSINERGWWLHRR
jgi:predicted transglutaminase-like cysteine proteinase